MSSPYEPTKLKEEAATKMLIIETAVEVKALILYLQSKNFAQDYELEPFRKQLRASPQYKTAYETAKKMVTAATLYENNPQAYLQELFKAKMAGTIN